MSERKLPTCEELMKDCQPPKEGSAYTKEEVDYVCGRMLSFVGAHLKVAIRGGKKGKLFVTERLDCFQVDNKDYSHPETVEAVLNRFKELGYTVTCKNECIDFEFNL